MRPLALVVENDGGTRKLLDVLLTRLGFEVDAVAASSEALMFMRAVRYDVVFVDLLLPGASGADVLSWIHGNRPQDLTRAVVLSGAPEPILREIREEFPRVRVFRKPFELSDIIDIANAARPSFEDPARDALQQFARCSVSAGAKAGVLVRTCGGHIERVHDFGYADGFVQTWFPMRVEEPFPLCMSMRDGQPRWLGSVMEAMPDLAAVWQQNQTRAAATVPVIRDGMVIGAAGWTFLQPRRFDDDERRTFTAIAADATAAF